MPKGLLQQAEAPEPKMSIGSATSSPGNQAATPEEESLMDQALAEVGNMIYKSDEANAALLDMIGSAPDPAVGIGLAVSQVVEVVDQKMDLPDDFLLPLAEAVTMSLIEMADAADILETSDDTIEAALMEAAKNLGQSYDIDAADLRAGAQDQQLAPEISRIGGKYAGQG